MRYKSYDTREDIRDMLETYQRHETGGYYTMKVMITRKSLISRQEIGISVSGNKGSQWDMIIRDSENKRGDD